MYGTIARMHVKQGAEGDLVQQLKGFEGLQVPGFVRVTLYRLDADARRLMMAVVFDTKENYQANAQSPEQNERYQQMRALLEADPEWHDGEVIAESGGR